MENKNIFQFDNSGWPDKGDALPEVFIKFPFKFDFTEEFLNLFRNKHTSTSFGYRWLYISDDKIFIHRGGRCLYQLMLNPDKLTHTAISLTFKIKEKRPCKLHASGCKGCARSA